MKKVITVLLCAGMLAAVACAPQGGQDAEERARQDSIATAAKIDSLAAAEQAAQAAADTLGADSL